MQPINDNVLRTVADELFELVKKTKRISVEDASKKLMVPFAAIESLVNFLVEEKVFGIEYKFTTPYVYLYKDGVKESGKERRSIAKKLLTKEQFYKLAKEREISYEQIEGLWRDYLQKNLAYLKEEFSKKARDRRIPNEKVDDLWAKYLSYL